MSGDATTALTTTSDGSKSWAELDSADDDAHVADEGQRWHVTEMVRRRARPVWLFGAGHVGRALAKVLVDLPFGVTWLDSRYDGFPEEIPAGISHVTAPQLATKVDEAPPATLFLVMTHSHQLDLEVCDRVLRRGDFAFLGLIGSETKKARFVSALKGRGHSAAALERLVCPIGLAQVPGKQPMAIAVSTAAQLLALPAAEAAITERGLSTSNHRGAG
jgi:xanthine dehydrogenase accessory factor